MKVIYCGNFGVFFEKIEFILILRLLTHICIFTFKLSQTNANSKKPEIKTRPKTELSFDSIGNTAFVFVLFISDAENYNAVYSL